MAKKPQIRFKGHQDEWGDKKLGDIYNFLKGKGLSKEKLTYKGKNKCILYGEIFTRYNFEIADCISSTDFDEGIPSVAGDIIMPGSTTTDGIDLAKAVHIPENNILYGGDIIVLRPKDIREVNPYFQSTLLSSINREQIAAVAQGITIVHLHGSDLDDMHYLMPEVKEQQKIGEFFKTLDELICAKEEELEKLRQLKAALLEQMFPSEDNKHEVGGGNSQIINILNNSQFVVSATPNTPRIRFKGFTEPWERKTIGNISSMYSGGTPPTTVKEYYGGKIPFIRSGEIHGNKTELFITELGLNQSSAKLVKKGDVLMAIYGATSGEIDICKIEGAINQAILCINTTTDKYFFKCSWEKNVERVIDLYLQGAQGNLSAQLVRQVDIMVPSHLEQQMIGDFFREQDEAINAADQQIRKLKTIKQALMDKMFA